VADRWGPRVGSVKEKKKRGYNAIGLYGLKVERWLGPAHKLRSVLGPTWLVTQAGSRVSLGQLVGQLKTSLGLGHDGLVTWAGSRPNPPAQSLSLPHVSLSLTDSPNPHVSGARCH